MRIVFGKEITYFITMLQHLGKVKIEYKDKTMEDKNNLSPSLLCKILTERKQVILEKKVGVDSFSQKYPFSK